jgi:hypothetical protein
MKILYFFQYLWVNFFALLDPDLNQATQINTDLDLQPWMTPTILQTHRKTTKLNSF